MRFKLFIIPVLAVIFCCSFACNSTQKTNTDNILEKSSTNTTSQQVDENKVEVQGDGNNEQAVSRVIVKAVGNTMSEMAFDPKKITVKANTQVELTLVNLGSDAMMVHNLLVVKKGTADAIGVAAIKAGASKNYIPDHPGIIAASEIVKPLKKTVLKFDAPPAGDYVFVCTYPGHHLSMRGRFVVE